MITNSMESGLTSLLTLYIVKNSMGKSIGKLLYTLPQGASKVDARGYIYG